MCRCLRYDPLRNGSHPERALATANKVFRFASYRAARIIGYWLSVIRRRQEAGVCLKPKMPLASLISVQELESAVARLSSSELAMFSAWFEEFVAEAWDKQLETDVRDGKLDHLAKQADEHFEAGRCKPLCGVNQNLKPRKTWQAAEMLKS